MSPCPLSVPPSPPPFLPLLFAPFPPKNEDSTRLGGSALWGGSGSKMENEKKEGETGGGGGAAGAKMMMHRRRHSSSFVYIYVQGGVVYPPCRKIKALFCFVLGGPSFHSVVFQRGEETSRDCDFLRGERSGDERRQGKPEAERPVDVSYFGGWMDGWMGGRAILSARSFVRFYLFFVVSLLFNLLWRISIVTNFFPF